MASQSKFVKNHVVFPLIRHLNQLFASLFLVFLIAFSSIYQTKASSVNLRKKPWPSVHKAFPNQDLKIRLKLKIILQCVFLKLFFNYRLLVFNEICAQNKTSRSSKLFYERKCKFYSSLSQLNNRIDFIIVNCLQHVL